jgi:hypothetical protein
VGGHPFAAYPLAGHLDPLARRVLRAVVSPCVRGIRVYVRRHGWIRVCKGSSDRGGVGQGAPYRCACNGRAAVIIGIRCIIRVVGRTPPGIVGPPWIRPPVRTPAVPVGPVAPPVRSVAGIVRPIIRVIGTIRPVGATVGGVIGAISRVGPTISRIIRAIPAVGAAICGSSRTGYCDGRVSSSVRGTETCSSVASAEPSGPAAAPGTSAVAATPAPAVTKGRKGQEKGQEKNETGKERLFHTLLQGKPIGPHTLYYSKKRAFPSKTARRRNLVPSLAGEVSLPYAFRQRMSKRRIFFDKFVAARLILQ